MDKAGEHENGQSDKAKQFVLALRALCIEHDVQLAVSGYDSLEVWNLSEGDDPLHSSGINDKTSA